MSLLIVGVVAFDSIETPFGKSDKILGGPATYAAITGSYFGVKTQIISKVGKDFEPQHFQLLKNRGIETSQIETSDEGNSFFWAARYNIDMNSRDTLATELNVYESFRPKVHAECQPSVVLLGNDHPKNQLSVIHQLSSTPKLIVLDTMNYWMDNAWEDLMNVLKEVNVLTINDSEARQLSGEYSLVKAAQKILNMGPQYLVIKKGEHGALLFSQDDVFFAPALPLEEVFDPTGAGDSFAGGFAGYLTQTQDFSFANMKRAVIYGSAMASFCVEKFGTQRIENLSEEELSERVQEFKDLIHFEI